MPIFSTAEFIRYRNATLPESGVRSPLNWLVDWFGGTKTASGQKVNESNAISLTTFFNAVTLISENMATIPFAPHVKEQVDGRTNDRILKEHFTYQLVSKRPNKYISSHNFRKVMFAWACRYDDAYAIIERDGSGRPLSMTPIEPEKVQMKQNDEGEIFYLVDETKIDFMDMFHLVGFTNNGFKGSSRVRIAKEALGKSMAAQQFGAKFFGKGINVSGFIKTPKLLKDEASVRRLKQSFAQQHAGANNEFGVGLLEDGSDYVKNELTPQDAQLNENFKVDGMMVAQLLNIPLTMLKFLERGTHNNVEQLYIQFVTSTLIPWGVNYEQECWYKLLTEREKEQDSIFYKFNFNGLLRGDMAARAQFYESLAKVGAYSPNRILELEDENGYDGGDIHVVSPGSATVEQLQNEESTATQD